jgi:hypothetical protein
VENTEELGPVLSLLQARPLTRVFLFCTGPDYRERARIVERAGGKREKAAQLLGLNAPAFRKALRERFPDLTGEAAEE